MYSFVDCDVFDQNCFVSIKNWRWQNNLSENQLFHLVDHNIDCEH